MVRSRSQTNLNRIYLDLCTSPSIRSKHVGDQKFQTQPSPHLPRLQSIKSNSCSDLTNLQESNMHPLPLNNYETEHTQLPELPIRLHLEPLGPRVAIESSSTTKSTTGGHSTGPITSTSFPVQSSADAKDYASPPMHTKGATTHRKSHESRAPFYAKSISCEHTLKDNKKTMQHRNFTVDDSEHSATSGGQSRESTSIDQRHSDTGSRLLDRFRPRKYLRKLFMS